MSVSAGQKEKPFDPSPEQLLERFLAQSSHTTASNTQRAYRATIRTFQVWCAQRTGPSTLQDYFDDHPAWTAGTCAGAALRLEKFLRFAGTYPVTITPDCHFGGHAASSVRLGLSPGVVERVFNQIPERQARDALLYRLLYFGRLRVGEVAALRVKDIEIHSPSLCYIHVGTQARIGKGNKELRIDDPVLIERLRGCLDARRSEELLLQASKSDQSRPLRQQNLHRRWRAYASKAGVSCSLEDLRVSGLFRSVQGSGDIHTLHWEVRYKKLESTRHLVTLANHLGLKGRGSQASAPVSFSPR